MGSYSTFVLFAAVTELEGSSGFGADCITPPSTVQKQFNPIGQLVTEEGYFGYNDYRVSFNSTSTMFNADVVPGTYDWLAIYGIKPTLPLLTHHWQNYNIGRAEVTPGGPATINRGTAGTFTQFPFTFSGGLPAATMCSGRSCQVLVARWRRINSIRPLTRLGAATCSSSRQWIG